MQSFRVEIALGLLSLMWVAGHSSSSLAQTSADKQQERPPTAPDLEADAVFAAWRGEPSVQRCGVCHYSPGNLFAKRDTDFCRLTELEQWLKSDKHAIARQRVEPIAPSEHAQAMEHIRRELTVGGTNDVKLPESWVGPSNALSFAMCQRLGYDVATEEGYAQFRENCLTCHGGYEAGSPSDGFAQRSATHPGISCSYCHQLGSEDRWIDEHSGFQAKATWRTLSPSAKAEKGMRDLVTAEAQSELCFRCHIGDIKHNMFVTHAMYAAGHPPLPGVELSTLSEAMPRHWRSPDERYRSLEHYPQRSAYFAANMPAIAEVSREQTRIDKLPWRTEAMISGALGAQQHSLRLLGQAADADSMRWGDYALYDCAACHHELRVPSVRQAARRSGNPGRPRLLEWPQVLSRAAESAAGADEAVAMQRQRLTQAIAERPFGDRAAVGQAAQELDQALQQLRQRLAVQALHDSFAGDMLSALVQTPDELLIDYHAARQVNWAVRCIDAELARLDRPLAPNIRAAISQLGLRQAPAPAQVQVQVSTALPSGIHQSIYPASVQAELERQAHYDSAEFSAQLKALSSALSRAPR